MSTFQGQISGADFGIFLDKKTQKSIPLIYELMLMFEQILGICGNIRTS